MLHRIQALRYARAAQIASLLIVTGAFAIWLSPSKPLRKAHLPQVQAPRFDEVERPPALTSRRIAALADRLELAITRPVVVLAEELAPEPEEPVAQEHVAYLSAIYEGTPEGIRRLALISIDGRQRIVREGTLIGDARLAVVADHEILLERASETLTVARSDIAALVDQAAHEHVAYLGDIFEGTPEGIHHLALISIDGRQRIVREGTLIGDARLAAIRENEIHLERPAGDVVLARDERRSSAVTWLAAAATSHAGRASRSGRLRVRTVTAADATHSEEHADGTRIWRVPSGESEVVIVSTPASAVVAPPTPGMQNAPHRQAIQNLATFNTMRAAGRAANGR